MAESGVLMELDVRAGMGHIQKQVESFTCTEDTSRSSFGAGLKDQMGSHTQRSGWEARGLSFSQYQCLGIAFTQVLSWTLVSA